MRGPMSKETIVIYGNIAMDSWMVVARKESD